MSYDALIESLRLLQGAPLPDGIRLSRRVRHVPLAVDRDGDVAATMFLRRGVSGVPLIDVHLELTRGVWRMLGGGGGPGHDAVLPRPGIAELGGPATVDGGGGTARTSTRWRRDGWVRWAQLRVAREVAVLQIGTRQTRVPGHGCGLVVWTRRPPPVTALDASGAELGEVALRR